MEEKVLIKGIFLRRNTLKIGNTICLCLIALQAIQTIQYFITPTETIKHGQATTVVATPFPTMPLMFLLLFSAIFYSVYFAKKNANLTVTNTRVCGRTCFGKRVDLPINKISAVSINVFKTLCISTSSGVIKFSGIKNRDEVFNVISTRLSQYQESISSNTTIIKQEIPQSNAEEIKKFMELLDMGIITEEEFNAKKKELLGILIEK